MIAGIGINIYTKDWPEELKSIAGSLYDTDPDTIRIHKGIDAPDPGTVAGRLTIKIAETLKKWIFEVPAEEFLSYYKSRSTVLGKEIEYIEDGRVYIGTAVDIDGTGGLVVQTDTDRSEEKTDLKTIILRSGEISVKMR